MKLLKLILFLIIVKLQAQYYPVSDPHNYGNWILNDHVSDEFNDIKIDEKRWYIVGEFKNNKPLYKHPDKPYKKVWKGRAPSQFSGRNYRLDNGILKLEARWEPNFPFSKEINTPVFGNALPYKNITTACFISRKEFKYGYIEIRSKAIDAEISSAFWSIGKGFELDFYETFGDGRVKSKEHLDCTLWWSIRDWKKLKGKPTYTVRKQLNFRPASNFHIYGIDWSKNGIKYYIDGKLVSSVTAQEVRSYANTNRNVTENYNGYVATNPINLWLDIEVFPWNGMPLSKEDLTLNGTDEQKAKGIMDYEIDYIRVWQK